MVAPGGREWTQTDNLWAPNEPFKTVCKGQGRGKEGAGWRSGRRCYSVSSSGLDGHGEGGLAHVADAGVTRALRHAVLLSQRQPGVAVVLFHDARLVASHDQRAQRTHQTVPLVQVAELLQHGAVGLHQTLGAVQVRVGALGRQRGDSGQAVNQLFDLSLVHGQEGCEELLPEVVVLAGQGALEVHGVHASQQLHALAPGAAGRLVPIAQDAGDVLLHVRPVHARLGVHVAQDLGSANTDAVHSGPHGVTDLVELEACREVGHQPSQVRLVHDGEGVLVGQLVHDALGRVGVARSVPGDLIEAAQGGDLDGPHGDFHPSVKLPLFL